MPFFSTPRQLTQRAHFYQQFAQLTAAGVPIIKTLETFSKNPPERAYRGPVQAMVAQIYQGATFTEAVESLGRWAPAFDIALIRAGEHSGRLDQVFRLLSGYYMERAAILRRMISDLLYPMFLFHFAIVLFPFLTWFKGGSLEAFLLQTVGILAPLYLLIFVVIYALQGQRGEVWRARLEQILRPVPALGSAREALALARLSAALEALVNAGVTIIEAWELAATASGSPRIEGTVRAWRPQLQHAGVTPAEAVTQSGKFPELFCNLYRSGEVSGQLDESLRHLHRYYLEEGTRKMQLIGQWLPRGVYLCVAALVAFKVIGFYSNYFSQLNSIGN